MLGEFLCDSCAEPGMEAAPYNPCLPTLALPARWFPDKNINDLSCV